MKRSDWLWSFVIILVISVMVSWRQSMLDNMLKDTATVTIMRDLRTAVENYADTHGGNYPDALSMSDADSIKAHLTGGVWPQNPFEPSTGAVLWGELPSFRGQVGYTKDDTGSYRISGIGSKGPLSLVS